MLYLLYFIVILFSNTVGAVSGMGGGVIIKPALDAIGAHPLNVIGFFSSAAVFTMSIVSIIKQVRGGFQISWQRLLAIAFGSIIGGRLGDTIFNILMSLYNNPDKVQLIQIIITIITLGLSIWYTYDPSRKQLRLAGLFSFFLASLALGVLSTLLGIGGGPMNVALFIALFGASTKQATVYSIITIFFSQLSKLTSIVLAGSVAAGSTSFLLVILPAAVIGGYIGSALNQRMTNKAVNRTYLIITASVILLNIVNGVRLFL
ncbi:sulfite exporter TauE/SafE family protein [Aerococcus sanguinicola]|uniref:Probable membrane transporter protein n=1 Tax=Aerococcus sanguinicola TaxID=119206 RepID=A0A0X8FCE7_9LACT|nr:MULTISPECIES: sulfite exporter TauE/SafE family protein [Aerococcus]AMB93952.1 hypothetical protein AWM72_03845 [Aerococcus sanguinicola]MDK7050584.1 sulfite exporter TauE/SafE family protein [Aerococcus sanguinicola]OFT97386.1 hypothetical protein HMPREF3090_00980 [Aerococcus sp. HMSC23C02]PKZ21098.1 sulfite exporter TauE/SafE family protein [Aerococcus sanguinicola]